MTVAVAGRDALGNTVRAGGVALQAHVKQYLREGDAAAPKVFAAEVVDRSNGTFEIGFDLKHACDFEVHTDTSSAEGTEPELGSRAEHAPSHIGENGFRDLMTWR